MPCNNLLETQSHNVIKRKSKAESVKEEAESESNKKKELSSTGERNDH